MDILSLTTTGAVRAVLGIDSSSGELPDEAFTDIEIEDMLQLDLGSWLPVELSTAMMSTGSTILALRACAMYHVALLMLPSLRHAAANKLSDGQNEMQRQPRDFDALRDELTRALQKYQQLFVGTLNVVQAQTTFFGTAKPSFDPVTG